MTIKALKEERALRDWIFPAGRGVVSRKTSRLITALIRAVRFDEREKSAICGYNEYLQMFGTSKQNVVRAETIATVIRRERERGEG